MEMYGWKEIGGWLVAMVVVLLPVFLLLLDFVFFIRKKEKPIFEWIAFFTGGIYTIYALVLWDLPDYKHAINFYGMENAHEPINFNHYPAIILFAIWGFVSYFILKFFCKKLAPLVEVFLMAGVYVGMALSIVWMVQLLCGASAEGMDASLVGEGYEVVKGKVPIHLSEFDYFIIFCLCVIPFVYLCHCVLLMLKIVREKAEKQKTITYENHVMRKINGFLLEGSNIFLFGAIALLPVLGVLVMILLLFGQQPDSIILAFTKTSDWILSKEIAPPPVAYDTHYLCTVSLRGHKKLVKPIRYGIRRGEKIVVNRQLCVANAFEQLIEERTPNVHRIIRKFYDTYGYPISRHIHSAWTADVVYLMMKPLEWFFVAVLYLCDEKPENRIHTQYLPKKF